MQGDQGRRDNKEAAGHVPPLLDQVISGSLFKTLMCLSQVNRTWQVDEFNIAWSSSTSKMIAEPQKVSEHLVYIQMWHLNWLKDMGIFVPLCFLSQKNTMICTLRKNTWNTVYSWSYFSVRMWRVGGLGSNFHSFHGQAHSKARKMHITFLAMQMDFSTEFWVEAAASPSKYCQTNGWYNVWES